ncbi:hypothetical protein MMC10_005795 [Thelotrema lepadinum]|nr:hypothetical protein [Thelotrema lepadinum]
MIATHVDSPCLKIKPFSEMRHAGYSLVGVETYGGGLWHTWLDRDLGVAGRAYVRTDEWRIESRLVKVDLPLLRISSLAAHFHDHNPLKLNNETHLIPIAGLGSERKQPDSFKTRDERGDDSKESTQPSKERILWQTAPATSRHIPNLVEHVATKLNMQPADIANFDLSLYDIQKATVGGTSDEFVFGRGIDNLMMTYCGLIALTQSVSAPESLSSDRTIRLLSLFDNEETGSKTGLGGGSTFLPNTLRRLSLLPDPSSIQTATSKLLPTIHEQALSRSFLISADMIHGIHPLHTGYHETNHKPLLNSGLVLYGAAGRNLTKNTPGHLLISELACRTTPSPSPAPSLPPATSFNDVVNANDPNASPTPSVQGSANPDEYTEPPKMQYFVQPNNISCGSTLGIILAPLVGVRTAEVGNAQMSMHSIREMAGSRDLENAIRVFRAFWMGFESVEGEIDVD